MWGSMYLVTSNSGPIHPQVIDELRDANTKREKRLGRHCYRLMFHNLVIFMVDTWRLALPVVTFTMVRVGLVHPP